MFYKSSDTKNTKNDIAGRSRVGGEEGQTNTRDAVGMDPERGLGFKARR